MGGAIHHSLSHRTRDPLGLELQQEAGGGAALPVHTRVGMRKALRNSQGSGTLQSLLHQDCSSSDTPRDALPQRCPHSPLNTHPSLNSHHPGAQHCYSASNTLCSRFPNQSTVASVTMKGPHRRQQQEQKASAWSKNRGELSCVPGDAHRQIMSGNGERNAGLKLEWVQREPIC